MSAHISVKDLPANGEKVDAAKIKGLQMLFGVVGVVCLGIVLVFMFMPGNEGEQSMTSNSASYSYLFAVTFGLTIGIGGLFWTMLHHATNSGWGTVVRRQFENVAGILPWMILLMIPFLCPQIRSDLWEWTTKVEVMKEAASGETLTAAVEKAQTEWSEKLAAAEQAVETSKAELSQLELVSDKGIQQDRVDEAELILAEIQAKEPTEKSVRKKLMKEHNGLLAGKYFGYFNWSITRLIIVGLIFIALVYALRSWSIKNDTTGDKRYFLRCRYWSCGFIAPFAVAFTFLVIDLLMTMNYKWFSTMWGVYLFAGAALNSMALIIVAVTFLRDKGYLKNVVTMEHYHLKGKLMFAFCVFWAYISFSQYFLIWYANITEETEFFLLRNSGAWKDVSIFLVIGHFFIPFIILLWRPVKKIPHVIAAISIWNLFMHAIDIYWIVAPERGPSLSSMGGGQPTLWLYETIEDGVPMNPLIFGTIGLDILALVGVIGVMGFAFLSIVKRSSLYPCKDPRLEESINVVN